MIGFARTTSTVFVPAKSLSIQREKDILALPIAYEEQQASGADPNRALLEQAKTRLEQRLAASPLDEELVQLAQAVYSELGEYQIESRLLCAFLALAPDTTMRAWAWWHFVDSLALARCAEEVVSEQQAFLAWALTHFPAEECFFVIADGTQARSWLMAGSGHAWLQQCHLLFQQASRTDENRLDRFYCLRTAVQMALELHEEAEGKQTLARLHDLLNEDASWPERWWVSVEIDLLEMEVVQRDIPQMRAKAAALWEELFAWEQEHLSNDTGTEAEKQEFRSLAHNTAAMLYRARQYDLAIPLFQKAIDYRTIPHYAYLWLAAALWQTTRDRTRVLPLLAQAAARYARAGDPWATFQRLPEFQDVREDEAFRQATKRTSACPTSSLAPSLSKEHEQ